MIASVAKLRKDASFNVAIKRMVRMIAFCESGCETGSYLFFFPETSSHIGNRIYNANRGALLVVSESVG